MKRYKFQARIEAVDRGGAHVFFPYDTQKEFGTKGQVRIQATFDGVPYAGSLVKYGQPQHMLPLLKAIRESIGKGPGDMVAVELWRDESVRTVEVPAAFQAAMNEAGVTKIFEALSYTNRKEYCRWITEAKREATRATRLSKAIQMLKEETRTPG